MLRRCPLQRQGGGGFGGLTRRGPVIRAVTIQVKVLRLAVRRIALSVAYGLFCSLWSAGAKRLNLRRLLYAPLLNHSGWNRNYCLGTCQRTAYYFKFRLKGFASRSSPSLFQPGAEFHRAGSLEPVQVCRSSTAPDSVTVGVARVPSLSPTCKSLLAESESKPEAAAAVTINLTRNIDLEDC